MNVVSQIAMELMKLKTEPHPHPYKVDWVDKTTMSDSQRWLVQIWFATYKDQVWCDVFPMDVSHILLGEVVAL